MASVERVEQGSTLVAQAGTTMEEVVGSIRRVTDIMGEISGASNEQSQGIAQVGEAVTQMDQVTQQNAALVEEMAAAATSLKSQAEDLVQVVRAFKLSSNKGGRSATTTAAISRARLMNTSQQHRGPLRKLKASDPQKARVIPVAPVMVASSAPASDDWETF